MLRQWLTVGAAVLLITLLFLVVAAGVLSAWFFALYVGVLLAGLVFERYHYKTELASPPGPGWLATEERIVDAAGTVRVWCHPITGERAYVREHIRQY